MRLRIRHLFGAFRAVCAVVVVLVVASAYADAGAAESSTGSVDKSRYTLLDPTPRSLLRELNTDRPDVTESPVTVDAGHVQVELSLLDYAHDRSHGQTLDAFSVLPANVKLGLLNNVDLQLLFQPYVSQRVRGHGSSETSDGFGATQVRLKINFWGNEGDTQTALGIMPFVQFPTADDELGDTDHVEGGLILPLSVSLPDEWELATMAEVDVLRDAADEGYGYSLLHTVSLSHPIAKDLDGFVEYVGFANRELGEGYVALAGAGITYLVTTDVQLDGAIYFGLSEAADDVTATVGISFRI